MEQQPETQAGSADAGAATSTGNQGQSVAFKLGRGGILGVKAGMTQVYTAEGESLAVTVIDLKPSVITQVKTKDKNGYQAIQVGFLEKKAKSATKAEQGHVKAVGKSGFYHYQEFRIADADKLDGLTVGSILSPEFLKEGDLVDLTSISKCKGFQGGVKRFHMGGGNKTHGASLNHRSLGSIGMRADPGRVFKGQHMPGQMGNIQVTVQNVRVIRIDTENNLLLVNGSVPGPRTSIVTVRKAIKPLARITQTKAKGK